LLELGEVIFDFTSSSLFILIAHKVSASCVDSLTVLSKALEATEGLTTYESAHLLEQIGNDEDQRPESAQNQSGKLERVQHFSVFEGFNDDEEDVAR